MTCSTTGCDFGVTPGMEKIPAICGVTRTTIDVEGSVVPLMISIWRVRPMISNCKPETTGMVMGAVLLLGMLLYQITASETGYYAVCCGDVFAAALFFAGLVFVIRG